MNANKLRKQIIELDNERSGFISFSLKQKK